jgi:arsenate reductase
MPEHMYNVLFLCTGNSARSIMADDLEQGWGCALSRLLGGQPSHGRRQHSIKVLESRGYPTTGLRSKSWDEFARADAPTMDFVFTVCDDAAGETCPHWPGQPMTAHWGIEDPAAVQGTNIQKEAAFDLAYYYLERRISLFRNLPIWSLDELTLRARLREISQTEGATRRRLDVAWYRWT